MSKSFKIIIGAMILILCGCFAYLIFGTGSTEKLMGGTDPDSFDVSATCESIEGNLLNCNKGNDVYLVLDGTKVYNQNITTTIDENGDENQKVNYTNGSAAELRDKVQSTGKVSVKMWLTSTGKINTIMIVNETVTNKNASLEVLGELDPAAYSSENVVLGITDKTITLAPANYNPEEADKYSALTKNYNFAVEVLYYNVDITTKVAKDKTETKNIQYRQSSYSEVAAGIGQGRRAYIWITRFGNVYAVMTINDQTQTIEASPNGGQAVAQ